MAITIMLTLRSSLCGGGVLPAALTLLALVPAPAETSEQIMSHADATSFACVLSSLNTDAPDEPAPEGCNSGTCLHPVEVATQSSFSLAYAHIAVASAPFIVSVLPMEEHSIDPSGIRSPPLFERARHHASSLVKRE